MSTMKNNYSILGFLVTITVVLCDKVDMSVSPRNVNLGSTLTVTCTGTLDKAGVVGPGMEIHKKILGTIYTISDGDRLNVHYASNARYSIKKYSNPTRTMYTFILTVKNTSLEDSGLFSCDFKPLDKEIISEKTTINVLHSPTLIKLTAPSNVSGEIRVKPNVGIAVKCLVQNYSPDAPSSARVFVGDMDVTGKFRKTTTNVVTGDQKLEAGGLVKIVYTTELIADNFAIEAGYSGKILRCASSIGGNSKVDAMNSVKIFVEGKPLITCPRVVIAKYRGPGFSIECNVTSADKLSQSDVSFHWNTSSGNDAELTTTKPVNHYKLHLVSLSSELMQVVLHFDSTVQVQHFRDYILNVNTSFGESMTTVSVESKDSTVQVQHFRDYILNVSTSFGESMTTVSVESKDALPITDNGQTQLVSSLSCLVLVLMSVFYLSHTMF